MPDKTRRISIRLEFDHVTRAEADLLATLTLAALTAKIGLAQDHLPNLRPKWKGTPGWLVYIDGEIEVPENLNP